MYGSVSPGMLRGVVIMSRSGDTVATEPTTEPAFLHLEIPH
jgi:hypothetical protein